MFNPAEYAAIALTGMICFTLSIYETGRFVTDLRKGARRDYHLAISGALPAVWLIAIALLGIGVPGFFAVATAIVCGCLVFLWASILLRYAA